MYCVECGPDSKLWIYQWKEKDLISYKGRKYCPDHFEEVKRRELSRKILMTRPSAMVTTSLTPVSVKVEEKKVGS